VKKKKRTMAEYQASRVRRVAMSPGLQSVLDGMLLSDASIQCGKKRHSASISLWQHPSRVGWLEQLGSELGEYGMDSVIDCRVQPPTTFPDGRKTSGGEYRVLRTKSYVELVREYDRWYNPHKIVPSDLILDSVSLRHWFCGDGRSGDSKGTLGFCTDGFSHAEVEGLVQQLKMVFNIEARLQTNQRGHPQILVGKRDHAVKIQTIIEPSLHECCAYKLKHVRPLQTTGKGRRIPEDTKKAIIAKRWQTTVKETANQYGVSPSKVWSLWQ